MIKQWFSKLFKDKNGKWFTIGFVTLGLLLVLIALSKFNFIGNNENIIISKNIYNPSKTVIAGSNVSKKEYENDESIVESFVNYCNEKKYEKAYELLTDDCKEVLYPNLDRFVTGYCKSIFQTSKEFNLQAWVNNGNFKTYKIRYTEDVLSTGNYSDSVNYEDYITIVTIGEIKKINLNSYIGRRPINKDKEIDELKIIVEQVDVFLNKVIYKVSVKNKTSNTIQLDGLRKSKVAIGLSTNGTINVANKYILNEVNLTIQPRNEKEIKLEFANRYSSGDFGSELMFYDIILNQKKFIKDPEGYDNIAKIKISL